MAWFVIFENATGRLESIGQIVADDRQLQSRGLVKAAIQNPPADNEMWDETSRSFVARPAQVIRDKLDDVLADPLISRLTAKVQGEITTVIDRIFPPEQRRYS